MFALLSPTFWGLNNVINKFLMTKKFQGYFSMVTYLNFVDLIFAGIVYGTTSVCFEFPYVLFAMVDGVLPLFAFWFYSKALMVEEISRITPLFQFIPIFVVFLSVLFLEEILSGQKPTVGKRMIPGIVSDILQMVVIFLEAGPTLV